MFDFPLIVSEGCGACGSTHATVICRDDGSVSVSCDGCQRIVGPSLRLSDALQALSARDASSEEPGSDARRMVFGSSGSRDDEMIELDRKTLDEAFVEYVLVSSDLYAMENPLRRLESALLCLGNGHSELVESRDVFRAVSDCHAAFRLRRLMADSMSKVGCFLTEEITGICANGLPNVRRAGDGPECEKAQEDEGKVQDVACFMQRTGNSLPSEGPDLGCRACASFRTDPANGGMGACFASVVEDHGGNPVYRAVTKNAKTCGKFRAK